jgi:hypothetical protein
VTLWGAGCLSVPPLDAEGSTGEQTGGTTSGGASHSGGSSSEASTTNGTDVTTTTGDGSTGTSTTGTTGHETGSTTGGRDESIVFFDDFERPDSTALGNGWVEKTIDAWRLRAGRVQFEENAAGFSQDFIFQPSLDVSDVEVSVTFRYADVTVEDFPQVHGRLDPLVTQVDSQARSYGTFVDVVDGRVTIIRSNPGMAGTTLAEAQIGQALVDDADYRVTIRITGTDPVQLEGTLEAALRRGGWQEIATTFTFDDSAERITDAGAVGTSGNVNIQVISYDDFTVRDLTLE